MSLLPPEQRQALLWTMVGAGLLVLLALLSPVLSPFIAAAIIGYVLNPGVDWLENKGLPRVPAALAMMTLLALLVLALTLVVVPVLRDELPLLQQRLPILLDRIDATLHPWLKQAGISVKLDSAGMKNLLASQLASGGEWGGTVIESLKVGGTAVLGWLATLLLVPFVVFYLLKDWHLLLEHFAGSVPLRWRAKVTAMAQETDALLAQYLRGQLLVMLILAAYYSIALGIAGFDVALPVGLVTGLLVFIPYLGFGLGLLLAIVAAILQFNGLDGLVAVAVIYSVGQVIESFFLTPYLVGERIGLHPLAVIFALLAFGQLFGFTGILLALPASAILSVALAHLRRHYLNSSFYNQP